MVLLAIATFIEMSCSKEYSCERCQSINQPPVAMAGPDQLINLPGNSVLLNGSASYDQDGKITQWKWTRIAGSSSLNIRQPDSAQTIAGGLMQGIYQFELQVTDDKGALDKDTVQITVNAAAINNHPPMACAGQDQNITLPTNAVVLNGTCSSDPDNNISTYLWMTISAPASPTIASANTPQTPVSNLVEGTYLFQLNVTDSTGLISADTVKIVVSKQPDNSPVDIYVTGMADDQAVYWKNGQGIKLPSQSSEATATAIEVVGSDVYVAGEEGDLFIYKNNRAKYWKNGMEVFLTGPIGAGATSIAVSGSDVYVAGWQYKGSKSIAIYWKNGQPVELTDGSEEAEATGIVVDGSNVYVVGWENRTAKYWKNGQPVALTDGKNTANAWGITIAGGSIYVSGSEVSGSTYIAKYWKDGQPVSVSSGVQQAYGMSIAVDGNSIYVAGYEGEYSQTNAVCWNNGIKIPLINPNNQSIATSIAVWGGNVFVAGYEFGANSQFMAKYWKNGQAVFLSSPSGTWATCIKVVKK